MIDNQKRTGLYDLEFWKVQEDNYNKYNYKIEEIYNCKKLLGE